MIIKCLGLILLAALSPAAAETKSGLSFLKIGIGARAIGLGSAYTAMSNDVTSIYWNPAGLGTVRKQELSAMHGEWLLGSKYDFLGYGRPLERGALAFGISVLTHPSMESRDSLGRKTGSFDARDMAFSLGYAQRLSYQFQGGIGVKLIESQIGQDKGQGIAFDIGSIYHLAQTPLSFGVSLKNLGPGIKYINETTKLPLTASFGAAYNVIAGFNLAADIRQQVYDQKTSFSLGTEYSVIPMFTLRGGYLLGNSASLAASSNQMLNGLGAGFGLKIMGYRIDYAFTPFGELGDTHRVSLAVRI